MCLQAGVEVLAQILFHLTLALVKKLPSASYPPIGFGLLEPDFDVPPINVVIKWITDLRYLIGSY